MITWIGFGIVVAFIAAMMIRARVQERNAPSNELVEIPAPERAIIVDRFNRTYLYFVIDEVTGEVVVDKTGRLVMDQEEAEAFADRLRRNTALESTDPKRPRWYSNGSRAYAGNHAEQHRFFVHRPHQPINGCIALTVSGREVTVQWGSWSEGAILGDHFKYEALSGHELPDLINQLGVELGQNMILGRRH